ncbi:unnamed protein product [Gadus morhua 'NCC']
MGKNRRIKRQEGDQETLCGDSSSSPGEHRLAQEEEATPDPDSSSPSPDPPPPHQVSTSSQKKERLTQVVIRWMETNEEANDPDQGQTPPDRGRTAPDRDQTAPDRGQTAPDRGQTAPDHGQNAQHKGQTPDEPADRALRKDLSQVTGNTRTRLRGLRELWAETRTIALLDQEEEKPLGRPSGLNPVPGQTAPDRGRTAPDRGQTPDEPDRALRKDLSQVTGNMRTRLRGLRELWAETLTIALLDQEEEKPLGRPSGLNPFPGQTAPDRGRTAPDRGRTAPDRGRTAPDRGQTAPDRGQTAQDHGQTAPDHGQTAPDQGQTPDEPADRALRKDLSQVTGNTRTRLRGLREFWAETLTIALLDQQEEKPLGRPLGLNPVPGQTAPDRGQTEARPPQSPERPGPSPDRPGPSPDPR